jgi:hypothetical protein
VLSLDDQYSPVAKAMGGLRHHMDQACLLAWQRIGHETSFFAAPKASRPKSAALHRVRQAAADRYRSSSSGARHHTSVSTCRITCMRLRDWRLPGRHPYILDACEHGLRRGSCTQPPIESGLPRGRTSRNAWSIQQPEVPVSILLSRQLAVRLSPLRTAAGLAAPDEIRWLARDTKCR